MSQRAVNGRLPAEAVRKFQRKSQKERLATLSEKAQAERQLAKVVKEIDNIVSAVSQGMFHPSMKAKMDALESD